MYQDDWLISQISRLADALSRALKGEAIARPELDTTIQQAVGLDLDTIDALPIAALLALVIPSDDRTRERTRVLAALLAASAAQGAAGDDRRSKARALLAHLDALPVDPSAV